MTTSTDETRAEIKAALDEFAAGLDGKQPELWVVEMASRIAEAALAKTREPEISVDVDGALSFDLRLASEYLLLAELEIDGSIDASVYDLQDKLVQRMPKATAEAIISWIQK